MSRSPSRVPNGWIGTFFVLAAALALGLWFAIVPVRAQNDQQYRTGSFQREDQILDTPQEPSFDVFPRFVRAPKHANGPSQSESPLSSSIAPVRPTLLAIIEHPLESIAVLRTNDALWNARKGDSCGDWEVMEVTSQQVTLTHANGESEALSLSGRRESLP